MDCETEETFLFAAITNVSQLGIFVRTDDPLDVGTVVKLTFTPPDAEAFAMKEPPGLAPALPAWSTEEALDHPYMADYHEPEEEPTCDRTFHFDFEKSLAEAARKHKARKRFLEAKYGHDDGKRKKKGGSKASGATGVKNAGVAKKKGGK